MARTNSFYRLSILYSLALCFLGGSGAIWFIGEARSASPQVVPMEGKALIVFVRAFSSDATSVDFRRSPVFRLKASESEAELVGILSVKTKIAYDVDAGKHLFMVVGENLDFMTADVLPNRTYFVVVTARVGKRTALYSLKAVDKQEQDSKAFTDLLALSKWIEKTAADDSWSLANMPSIKSRRPESYRLWTQKLESERPTLVPNDGVGGATRPPERAESGGASVKRTTPSVTPDAPQSAKPVPQPSRIAVQLEGVSVLLANAEKSVIANPKDAVAWRTLGDAHASAGDWNKAARAYEEGLRLVPSDSQTLASLALTYCKRYDRSQLDNAIDETRKTNPGLSEQIVRKCILP